VLVAVTAAGVTLATDDPVAQAAAATLGALATAILGTALVARRPSLVAPAAGLLGTAYAVSIVADGGPPDLEAPLTAAALLLGCELGYWSHELRTTAPDEPGARARRLAWLGVLGALAILPGAVVLAVADLVRVEGIAIETVGTLAACALVLGLVLVARGHTAS
jgi:hypothetical protein